MASIKEMAPGGRLHCSSPDHPPHVSKDTMYFLEERNGYFCFGCKLCTDNRKQLQLHVIAKTHGALRIHKNTRKADHIVRDNQGRITSFR